jgi:hypothetical protein
MCKLLVGFWRSGCADCGRVRSEWYGAGRGRKLFRCPCGSDRTRYQFWLHHDQVGWDLDVCFREARLQSLAELGVQLELW